MNTEETKEALAVDETPAKAEKKEPATKTVVVRCIAAALCAALVSASTVSIAGKLSEAKEKTAGLTPANSYVAASGNSYNAGGESYAVDSNTPSDTSTDGTAADGTDSSSYEVATEVSGDNGATQAAANNTGKPLAASEMNKAQIVALFNNAVNGAKKDAKSIKQNYTKNSQVASIEIKSAILKPVANELISANMGEDESKHDKTYTGNDRAGYFPVAGQSWSSKLTEADVKEAKITEANGVYSVEIKLVDDTQPNLKVGEGHAGKAISLVTKEQIVEGAGSVGMKFIEEDSIKVTHYGCVIKVKIDKNTGKLKTANYYRVWQLALTAIGIDIAIPFGIEEDYVINW